MNNCVYNNGFSLSPTGSVQFQRLGRIPHLVQPIAALIFIGRAFSLHLWCSLALLYRSFHYDDPKNGAEDFGMRHDSSSRPFPWMSQTFVICSSDRAFVDSQKRTKKLISHFWWRLILLFFHSGGFILVPLHFCLAGNQSGYTTLGYISGTAFAESLTAFLDGDCFILGMEKQWHYR